ncbi:unnamed protein product [Cylindrotheca closterium]|uniref:BZIP domain-containing protein n=1 Tax=Cylindrotheca closterium TaxID=2856 RepID=A0AAD2FW36_9STRA|nr:unnamed protein product [Cylindrotheca closterium]
MSSSTTTNMIQESGTGNLPMRKRKDLEGDAEEERPAKKSYMSKAREIRLEQNRKAARESRRRKKNMLEELQRSVIFFSRANGTLKQQNEELTRLLVQAQTRVSSIESSTNDSNNKSNGNRSAEAPVQEPREPAAEQQNTTMEQSEARAVAAQAIYESKGFPAAAARATAQSVNGTVEGELSKEGLPQMQPGATMQAMANFQQAATAAMQAAAHGMHGNGAIQTIATQHAPGVRGPQQVFSDTMAAIAMQQAAAAAAASGQQFLSNPFMAPMLAWQNHQVAAAMVQAASPQPPMTPSQNAAPQISSPRSN